MNSLFLDLASHNGSLACIGEDHVHALLQADHRVTDRELTFLLEEALEEAEWTYKDLTHLACVVGPGGFTSLRVAVSSMNALSALLEIPICSIHLSDLYKARTEEHSFLWLHSTKKQEMFVRGFGNDEKHFPEAVCKTLSDLEKEVSSSMRITGELIPEHQAWVNTIGMRMVEIESLEEVLPGFLLKQSFSSQSLVPWYGRTW